MPAKHLIVGDSPGPGADHSRRVLDSDSGRRLANYVGTTLSEVLSRCETVNADPTGLHTFPEVRERVRALVTDPQYDTVLLLGRRSSYAVWSWLGYPSVVQHAWTHSMAGGRMVFAAPHTSGLNRWWNDPRCARDGTVVLHRWWAVVTALTTSPETTRIGIVDGPVV